MGDDPLIHGSTFASDLGLRAGQWPKSLWLIQNLQPKGYHEPDCEYCAVINRRNKEGGLEAVVYEDRRLRTITIFND